MNNETMNDERVLNNSKKLHFAKYEKMYATMDEIKDEVAKTIAQSRYAFYQNVSVEDYAEYADIISLANVLADLLITAQSELVYAVNSEYPYIIDVDGENIYFNAWNEEEVTAAYAKKGYNFNQLLDDVVEATQYDYVGNYFKRINLTDYPNELTLVDIITQAIAANQHEMIYAVNTEYPYIIEVDGGNIDFNAWNYEEGVRLEVNDADTDLTSDIIKMAKIEDVGTRFQRMTLVEF